MTNKSSEVRVICRSAPLGYERYQGQLGYLSPPRFPLQLCSTFIVDGGENLVLDERGWVFESAAEHSGGAAANAERGDDQYNAADFERDLDEAISEARLMVSAVPELRLSFRSGELDRALGQVMAVLAWRALSERDRADACDVVWRTTRNLLIQKNAAYGDSALNPVRVFSNSSPMEQLLVRLDDKVSRLQRGHAAGEDVAADMLGYLLLVLIARIRERRQ